MYHCRCSICERAALTANVAAGSVVPSQAVAPTAPQPPQIILKEAPRRPIVLAIPEEEEESTDGDEEELAEDETVEEEDEEDWEACDVNPRKRSHDDDSVDDDDPHALTRRRSGSLSKRLRREEDYVKDVPAESPTRLRKRSSEELDVDDDAFDADYEADGREVTAKKKLRTDGTPSAASSPPVSLVGSRESHSLTPTVDEDPRSRGKSAYARYPRGLRSATPVLMSEVNMALLYTLEPPDEVDV